MFQFLNNDVIIFLSFSQKKNYPLVIKQQLVIKPRHTSRYRKKKNPRTVIMSNFGERYQRETDLKVFIRCFRVSRAIFFDIFLVVLKLVLATRCKYTRGKCSRHGHEIVRSSRKAICRIFRLRTTYTRRITILLRTCSGAKKIEQTRALLSNLFA